MQTVRCLAVATRLMVLEGPTGRVRVWPPVRSLSSSLRRRRRARSETDAAYTRPRSTQRAQETGRPDARVRVVPLPDTPATPAPACGAGHPESAPPAPTR